MKKHQVVVRSYYRRDNRELQEYLNYGYKVVLATPYGKYIEYILESE